MTESGEPVRFLAIHPNLWPELARWLAEQGRHVALMPGTDPPIYTVTTMNLNGGDDVVRGPPGDHGAAPS